MTSTESPAAASARRTAGSPVNGWAMGSATARQSAELTDTSSVPSRPARPEARVGGRTVPSTSPVRTIWARAFSSGTDFRTRVSTSGAPSRWSGLPVRTASPGDRRSSWYGPVPTGSVLSVDAAAGPGDAGGLRSAEGAARAADEGSAPLVVVAPEHASGLTDAEDLPCPGPEGGTQHLDARDRMLTGAYSASREIAAALDTTMRSALRAARPARRPLTLERFGRRSAPVLERLDEDVVAHGGEVALADRAVPDADPALPLRVALASVRSGQPIATVTRASLRRCPSPRGTWSDEPAVREDRERTGAGTAPAGGSSSMLGRLVDLLGSGDELVRVWEDLDRASLPVRWFPGWSAVLNRPQHNPLHLYTVDRHMVRTAAVAGRLLGDDGGARVLDHLGLPGLDAGAGSRDRKALLVTALLHDLGKVPGVVGEAHAAAGAQRVPAVLDVLGIAGADAEEIVLLVREHLLLGLAATKAPGDSAVVDAANEALGDGTRARRRLSLLRLLTEADSRAAGPRAWTSVRAGVVDQATAALAAEL